MLYLITFPNDGHLRIHNWMVTAIKESRSLSIPGMEVRTREGLHSSHPVHPTCSPLWTGLRHTLQESSNLVHFASDFPANRLLRYSSY